jgi:hypothetical protein
MQLSVGKNKKKLKAEGSKLEGQSSRGPDLRLKYVRINAA